MIRKTIEQLLNNATEDLKQASKEEPRDAMQHWYEGRAEGLKLAVGIIKNNFHLQLAELDEAEQKIIEDMK